MTKFTKRLLSLVVAVVMIISLLPVSVFAEEVTGLTGEGTQASPYLINNLAELEWFRDDVNTYTSDGSNQYYGKYVQLNADIDLSGINWEPIGINDENDHNAFLGTFDGNGHTISNLYVEKAGGTLGFFAYTSHFNETLGGTYIKNLTFNNVTVKSTDNSNYVGGVIANSGGWTYIDNVHVTGSLNLSGGGYIGGIVGHGYAKISDCSVVAEGTISSTFWCAGGIVGYGGEGGTSVSDTYVEGTGNGLTITSAAGALGAIVGNAKSGVTGSNLSAENVSLATYTGAYGDSYANYGLGYLFGGTSTDMTGTCTVKNVTITTSSGEEATPVDAEVVTILPDVPEAEVTRLSAMTLTEVEHDYMVWPSGDDTIDRPLEIVVNFKATEEDGGSYAEWLVDFNLTVTGLAGDSIVADNCYMAGNYGTFGWIVIPTDGVELEADVAYPVVSAYDATLNYKDICTSVKDFTAAIHIDAAILEANPDMEVKLELIMTDPENADNKLQVGEDMVYNAAELAGGKGLPEAEVTVLGGMTIAEEDYRVWNGVVSDKESEALVSGEGEMPLEAVLNFKAIDTLEECLAGGYSKWLVDFNITIDGLADGTFVADKCYLAGNYGSYGWIKIPLDGETIEEGIAYPVVALYDPTLNYKDICKSVKDFTAALHIDQAVLNANPDMTVTLVLKMTNPDDANDNLLVGEPYVYDVDALQNGASAQNKDTNELYTSAQDAIDEAAVGETVVLLRDFDEEEIYVKRNRTLDLNGCTLSAADVIVHSTSQIVDSTNGDALLVVEKEYLAVESTNPTQVPVWTDNGEVAGYRFTGVNLKQKATLENTDRAYYRFYFTDSNDCLLANELKDGGADNSITVEVKLTWTDANGQADDKSFIFTEENVMQYAGNWDNKMFYLYINGMESVTDLTIAAAVVSSANEDVVVTVSGEAVQPA